MVWEKRTKLHPGVYGLWTRFDFLAELKTGWFPSAFQGERRTNERGSLNFLGSELKKAGVNLRRLKLAGINAGC